MLVFPLTWVQLIAPVTFWAWPSMVTLLPTGAGAPLLLEPVLDLLLEHPARLATTVAAAAMPTKISCFATGLPMPFTTDRSLCLDRTSRAARRKEAWSPTQQCYPSAGCLNAFWRRGLHGGQLAKSTDIEQADQEGMGDHTNVLGVRKQDIDARTVEVRDGAEVDDQCAAATAVSFGGSRDERCRL